MATTPNYNFIMPDPTDFVTDLPADFEIFGDEVDLRIKALNPETTAGDLAYRGATADAKDRLGIGTAGQVLKVNSGATAPEWGSVPAPADVWSLITSVSPSGSATSLSINVTGYKRILAIGRQIGTSAGGTVTFRLNADATGIYENTRNALSRDTSNGFTLNSMEQFNSNSSLLQLNTLAATSNDDGMFNILVNDLNVAGFKTYRCFGFSKTNTSNLENFRMQEGIYRSTAVVTSLDMTIASGGNLNSGGAIRVYGA